MKKILLIVLLIGLCGLQAVRAQAPGKVSIEGTVTDFATKAPLSGAVVSIPQLSLWAVADSKGHFKMPSVTTGSYNIEVTYLGYETLTYPANIGRAIANFDLRMKATSLALNTVVVTATKGIELNTSAKIDRQAMDHIQASTLKTYMELIPGTAIVNQSLTESQRISLRDFELGGDNANNPRANSNIALGTAIIVDGSLTTDAASIAGPGSSSLTLPESQKGYDTRHLATDQIESIEVLTGVVSAQYGNLNSGAVIVKTKAGRTPYEFSAKTDPNSKIYSFGKGFALGGNNGFLNVNAEYANAYKDLRTDEDAYDRTALSARYSNTFNRNHTPLTFNASVNGYLSEGSTKNDPDNASKDDLSALNDNSFELKVYGSWQLRKSWISSLQYSVNYRMTNQFSKKTASVGAPDLRHNTMEDIMFITHRTAPEKYISDLRNESRASYANAKLVADLSERYGIVYNSLLVGGEWNNSGNRGRGFYYVGVPTGTVRNADARDYIPFVNQYSAFAEDKVTVPFNNKKSSVTAMAGVRFMKVDATDVLKQTSAVDPRFNLQYAILQNNRNHKVRDLSVRVGWGIQTVLPNLQFLYNIPQYTDRQGMQWNASDDREQGAIYTNFVFTPDMMRNRDLKFQRSKNFEVGTDFNMFGIKGSVVYFREQIYNGYRFDLSVAPLPMYWNEYKFGADGTATADDDLEPKLTRLADGTYRVTTGGGVELPVSRERFAFYAAVKPPNNNNKVRKWGIEGTFDFGQIPALRTSVRFTTQYLYREVRNSEGCVEYATYTGGGSTRVEGVTGQDNPVIAGFLDGTETYLGTKTSQLTSNLMLITHIPKLRLVTTVTIQCIAFRRAQSTQAPGLYHYDENGQRVYGDYSHGWHDLQVYRDPTVYMTADGVVHPFDASLYTATEDGPWDKYRTSIFNKNYYVLDKYAPYFMGKIQVTKEIGKIASVSFYANNFTSSNPLMLRTSTDAYQRMNANFFFGAEVKIKF